MENGFGSLIMDDSETPKRTKRHRRYRPRKGLDKIDLPLTLRLMVANRDRLNDACNRFGYSRAHLVSLLIDIIMRDNLVKAILDEETGVT